MADNKTGPNLQGGAGFLAKRVQKSLYRAQEKVLQKLGKTMETKDEQFELCFQNLNKQQSDGNRLFKDVKAYYAAVKAVHETSRRLSQTLKDIYEDDWNGVGDLAVITESENMLLSDYEEKLNDQIVRTMENYTSQFPEVKERVSKRGRKLVDYDSARHHLEALQSAKKKDEAKISKAEEEFSKAQNVFEEINNELRDELPVLYQSRIGCYVTVFQNVSNLKDVFYKEMSMLNHELYNVMKKLETQHSSQDFIIKGLNSTSGKSKKRTSLVISNPIPCNTAFPADHVSIHSSTQDDKGAAQSHSDQRTQSIAEEDDTPKESCVPFERVSSSDSELSFNNSNTPKRQSVCNDQEDSDRSAHSQSPEEAPYPVDGDATQALDQGTEDNQPSNDVDTKSPPVPAPRLSFHSTDGLPMIPAEKNEEMEADLVDLETSGDGLNFHNPPGFLYKGMAIESHEASEDGQLQFEQGDIILVLADTQKVEGLLKGIREDNWNQHQDVENHSGVFSEKLILPMQVE